MSRARNIHGNQDRKIETLLKDLRDMIRGLQSDIHGFTEVISQARRCSPNEDRFMTRKEAANYLRRGVSSLEAARDLKFYKPGGGKVIYKKSDLDAWSESYSVTPVDLEAIDRMAMDDVLKFRRKLKKAS